MCRQQAWCQWVMLTTWLWWNFLSPEFGQSSRRKYLYLWRYPNFLTTQCGTGERKPLRQPPAQVLQLFRYNTGLWRTDRQTCNDGIYRAGIASCGTLCMHISFNWLWLCTYSHAVLSYCVTVIYKNIQKMAVTHSSMWNVPFTVMKLS